MKNKYLYFLISAFCLLIVSVTQATQITVNNNSNSPGQYTNLQTAINAAAVGDTILVSGSVTSYGSITVNKRLVLLGAGYNNSITTWTYIDKLVLAKFDAVQSANGSYISGFEIAGTWYYNVIDFGTNYGGDICSNIVIERCLIDQYYGIYFNSNCSYNNITIRDCVLYRSAINSYVINFGSSNGYTNINVQNCIINGYIEGNNFDLGSVKFSNNFFSNAGTGGCLSQIDNAVFNNNIFFKRDAGATTECEGCAFNNNITYATAANTLPYGTNVGSGNLINVDPKLNNFPSTGSIFDWPHNYNLQPGSPAHNAGTDGTDIGVTGGTYPFVTGAPPRIPRMTLLDANPSSVPLGGTLQVHFKATKQD